MSAGKRLTKRLVESLVGGDRDAFHWDTDVVGFGVRVKSSGARSFLLRYRPPGGGNDRKVTIGRFPSMSVEAAREGARELYAQRVRGGDPAADRKRLRAAMTVQELADYYLGAHAATKGNRLVTLVEYRRALARHVLPRMGSHKLDQVCRSDIADLMHAMADTPVAANRLRAVLSGMFAVAVGFGWAAGNPCKGTQIFRERPRQRFLSPEDQARVLRYLVTQRHQSAPDVVRLLLLTGARRGEVLRATWDMFDLQRHVWLKPSHHTKQGRDHAIVLPLAAVEILQRRLAAAADPTGFVFPQRSDPSKPIVGIKRFWSKLQIDLGLEGVRLHDLRHTTASVLISAGHSLAEVGGVLGHTQSRTTERYTHLFDDNMKRSATTLGNAFSIASEEPEVG